MNYFPFTPLQMKNNNDAEKISFNLVIGPILSYYVTLRFDKSHSLLAPCGEDGGMCYDLTGLAILKGKQMVETNGIRG
jgi:hypothetical protein